MRAAPSLLFVAACSYRAPEDPSVEPSSDVSTTPYSSSEVAEPEPQDSATPQPTSEPVPSSYRVDCTAPELVHLVVSPTGVSVSGMDGTADGGFVVVGSYEGTVSVPTPGYPTEIAGSGLFKGLVLKLSGDGILEWARTLNVPGSAVAKPLDVATGPAGELYIFGRYTGQVAVRDPLVDVELGSIPYHNSGDLALSDWFLMRLESDGSYGWSAPIDADYGATNTENGVRAAPDGTGAVVVLATGQDETRVMSSDGSVAATVNSGPLDAYASHQDLVVARYDAAGLVQWAKHVDGAGVLKPRDVEFLADGSVAAVGSGYTSLTVDGSALSLAMDDPSWWLGALFLHFSASGDFVDGTVEGGTGGADYQDLVRTDAGGTAFAKFSAGTVHAPGTPIEKSLQYLAWEAVHTTPGGQYAGSVTLYELATDAAGLSYGKLVRGPNGHLAVGALAAVPGGVFEDHDEVVQVMSDRGGAALWLYEADDTLACFAHLEVQGTEYNQVGSTDGLAFTEDYLWLGVGFNGTLVLPDGTPVPSEPDAGGSPTPDVAIFRVPLTYTPVYADVPDSGSPGATTATGTSP